jgi:hypothetical protein
MSKPGIPPVPPPPPGYPTSTPEFQRDPAKVQEIQRALDAKGADKPCARCATNMWHVDIVGIPVTPLPARGFQIPPPHIPAVILTCHHCGNIVIHHAQLLGVEP